MSFNGTPSPGFIPTSQMYGNGSPGMSAEGLMGSGMSYGSAMGGSMLGGAASMLGFDPMGMAFRAGSMAFGRGAGVMGIGMAGMGAFAGMAGVGLGASFMGNQMMQGAQNSMALNNALRQNFNFQTANGQGFNRPDMNAIGGTLQSMTHQVGAGGEVNTFGELSRLASNMGSMGMSRGVRDAQDFSKKFKEMVSTLKTVATELGTSLESAQELLASSRSSGIFKTSDQLKYGKAIRNYGMSGGLATSELTAMGNIGSTISRQFGGLGQQGAMGGMKALGLVGTANKMGIMSDEDIYNATGKEGAEGRQAMATEMMQSTGNFLRTGKGRWLMASLAGKDGKLDQNAVEDLVSGSAGGVQATRERAQRNLKGIGRANFIRNEGRLRGAVMEQLSGTAPALALMQWAQDRGIDINDMNDKSMLFAQRHLGMGRDELDQTIKMAQSLPDIMRKQRSDERHDDVNQQRAQHVKSRDVRVRLDQIKEKITGSIQKVGSDLFNAGSELIESSLNRLMGSYDTWANENIQKIAQDARLGGVSSTEKYHATFGGGSKKMMGMSSDQIRAMGAEFLNKNTEGGLGANATPEAIDRAREAGRAGQYAAASRRFGGQDVADFAKENKGAMLDLYNKSGIASARGDERVKAVQNALQEMGNNNPAAKALYQRMLKDKDTARSIVGTMDEGIGIGKGSQLGDTYEQKSAFAGKRGFASAEEQDKAFGELFTGKPEESKTLGMENKSIAAWGTRAVLGAATFGMSFAAEGGLQVARSLSPTVDNFATKSFDAVYNYVTGAKDGSSSASVGLALRDTKTQELMLDIAEGGTKGTGAIATLMGKDPEHMEPMEKSQLRLLQTTSFAARYANAKGNPTQIKALLEEANKSDNLKMFGKDSIDEKDLQKFVTNIGTAIGGIQDINAEKQAMADGLEGAKDLEYLRGGDGKDGRVGLITGSGKNLKVTSKLTDELGKMKDPASGHQAAKLAIGLMLDGEELTAIKGTDPESVRKRSVIMDRMKKNSNDSLDAIANLSEDDRRKFSSTFTGTQAADQARDVSGMGEKFKGIKKGAKGETGATIARYLGVNLGKQGEDDLKGKSDEDLTAFFAKQLGIDPKDKANMAELGSAIKGSHDPKVNAGKAGLSLERIKAGLSEETRKKLTEKDEVAKKAQETVAEATKKSEEHLFKLVGGQDKMIASLVTMAINTKPLVGGNSTNAEKPKGTL